MKLTYQQFLQTDIWKRTAQSVICRAGGQCDRCYTTHGPFHAHHITYLAGNRPDAPSWVPQGWLPEYPWLLCLCEDCHRYLHWLRFLPRFRETSRILQSRRTDQKRRLIVIELPFTDFGTENAWIMCQGRLV
jgi:hypothetical protein